MSLLLIAVICIVVLLLFPVGLMLIVIGLPQPKRCLMPWIKPSRYW